MDKYRESFTVAKNIQVFAKHIQQGENEGVTQEGRSGTTYHINNHHLSTRKGKLKQ
jgi:hypothetical protein